MKSSDLSPNRRACLVPLSAYSGAHALVPPPIPPVLNLSTVLGDLNLAHEALARLKALPHTLTEIVMWALDRRDAVDSSQIEGTRTEIDDLLRYEATHNTTGLPTDIMENVHYVRAQEHGLATIRAARSPQGFTTDLVCRLHQILMQDKKHYPGQAGHFRTVQNWIGGRNIYEARFVPPPADYVAEKMAELLAYLRYPPDPDGYGTVSIVLRMAIAHVHFQTIHPFADGNGRTGRMLIPLMLAAEGYPPVYMAGFLKRNQQTYYDRLLGVQLRDEWLEWIRFFAQGVVAAIAETETTLEQLLGLRAAWLEQTRHLRKDAAACRALDVLIGRPFITVHFLAKHLDISFPAANHAIKTLLDHGILHQLGDSQRNRVYIAQQVMRILARQEA